MKLVNGGRTLFSFFLKKKNLRICFQSTFFNKEIGFGFETGFHHWSEPSINISVVHDQQFQRKNVPSLDNKKKSINFKKKNLPELLIDHDVSLSTTTTVACASTWTW